MANLGSSNEQDNGNILHVGKATLVAIIGMLFGLVGSIVYLGASFRQIEVNSNRITEIETHGTGILQALKLQVEANRRHILDLAEHGTAVSQPLRIEMHDIQSRLDAIQQNFRSREYWENLSARLAAHEAMLAAQDQRIAGLSARANAEIMRTNPEREATPQAVDRQSQ